MRPLDPRLIRASAPVRRWLALCVAATVGTALCTVAIAFGLGHVITGVVEAESDPTSLVVTGGVILAAIFIVRAAVVALGEMAAERSAAATIADLRVGAFDRVLTAAHAGGDDAPPPTSRVALSDGLENMGPYLSRFLPTLVATSIVTPALIAVTWYLDWVSAVIEIVTVPLVPLFMALVGWATQSAAAKRLHVMEKLADQLLDLLAGLPTLRFARRAQAQARAVKATAEEHSEATMKVLRQAFLSSLVLEVLTTLSVALVAVGIGLRLMYGKMGFTEGLIVLILAPEVFLPLRLVGQHFHASADGVAAANDVLAVTQTPARPTGTARPARVSYVGFDALTVRHSGDTPRSAPHELTGVAHAGQITCLTGANGSGKSTACNVLLGLVSPTSGAAYVGDGDQRFAATDIERAWLHAHTAWVPQSPSMAPGTVEENLWWPGEAPTDAEMSRVLQLSGLTDVIAGLPDGLSTRIGHGGFGLSAGQRHRVALARAFARVERGAGLLIVDEPSAHLDHETADLIVRSLRLAADEGLVVLAIAHRGALLDAAEHTIEVTAT